MSTRQYPEPELRQTDSTTSTPTTADPTAGAAPGSTTGRRTTTHGDDSPAGAPLTFDPFCTRRCRNLVDDENASTPDPDDVTVVRPDATRYWAATDD